MLSRRDFLKISGLSTIAAASGFGAGKLFGSNNENSLRVQAFIPDTASAKDLTIILGREAESIFYIGDAELKRIINDNLISGPGSYNKGTLIVEVQRLKHAVTGDVLLSDYSKRIFDPDTDFSGRLTAIRNELKKKEAGFIYSAYYDNSSVLGTLFRTGTGIVVIEDETGTYDRFKLSGQEKEIFVKGPAGRTGIVIKDNSVHISSACCRNRLCVHSGAIKNNGAMIACAPNKVLVRIDKA